MSTVLTAMRYSQVESAESPRNMEGPRIGQGLFPSLSKKNFDFPILQTGTRSRANPVQGLHILKSKIDRHRPEKLKAQPSGILNQAVGGLRKYLHAEIRILETRKVRDALPESIPAVALRRNVTGRLDS
jgi:hypothetical protein